MVHRRGKRGQQLAPQVARTERTASGAAAPIARARSTARVRICAAGAASSYRPISAARAPETCSRV
jgi:hypothetical protein